MTNSNFESNTIDRQAMPAVEALDTSELTDLTPLEEKLLEGVQGALNDGLEMLRWWQRADANGSIAGVSPLMREPSLPRDPSSLRTFLNENENSYGFTHVVPQRDGALNIIGVVQELFYTRAQAPQQKMEQAAEHMKQQLKAFVLEYLLRSCSTRLPTVHAEGDEKASLPFSLKPDPRPSKNGFDYTQMFYQEAATGKVRRFPKNERRKIVRLDRIGRDIDWMMVKIDMHNFWFKYQFGSFTGITAGTPAREVLYLILHPDLMANLDNPSSDILGEYGFGYTFVANPEIHNVFGYGPEKVGRAFEYMHFRVKRNGEVWARAAFGSEGPARMIVDAGDFTRLLAGIADRYTGDMASRAVAPLLELLDLPAVRYVQPAPLLGALRLANAVTFGLAGSELQLDREGLDKFLMSQHYLMLYDFILHTLPTFKMVPDWTDPSTIPDWIKEGRSSN